MSHQITTDATSSTLTSNGIDYLTVDSAGNVALPQGLSKCLIEQASAQNTTSGTSIDFTGIPSWAKRIKMMLVGVSTSGTSNVIVQIGTSGGIVSTGYTGASDNQASAGGTATSFTNGLGLERTAAATYLRHGIVEFLNVTGNTWVGTYIGSTTGTLTVAFGSTQIALGGVLDRVRLTTVNGTDTFDAGTANVMWE